MEQKGFVTISDVAREANCSISTVSKYINGGKLRENKRIAIKNVIEKFGFVPNPIAQALKSSRSNTVGVLVPTTNNVFFMQILSVLGSVLEENGFATIICDCNKKKSNQGAKIDFLISKKVDAIISIPFDSDLSAFKNAKKNNLPIILADNLDKFNSDFDSVMIDNKEIVFRTTSILIEKYGEKVGFIKGPDDSFTATERLFGYLSAFESKGLKVDCNLIEDGGYTVDGGFLAMRTLAKNENIRSVIVSNYEMTMGAVKSLNGLEAELFESLHFVGFDNTDIVDILGKKIAIISQPIDEIGRKLAELAIFRVFEKKEKEKPKCVVLSADIVGII